MNLNLLIPVFNDWESCSQLMVDIEKEIQEREGLQIKFFIVNDCSTDECPLFPNNVHVIHLNRNVGHQRAIAIGLCYINDNAPSDYVVVMDGDGEDKATDIKTLLEKAIQEKDRGS